MIRKMWHVNLVGPVMGKENGTGGGSSYTVHRTMGPMMHRKFFSFFDVSGMILLLVGIDAIVMVANAGEAGLASS